MSEPVVKIYASKNESKQNIGNDKLGFNNIIEPFFSFENMLSLYYANTYHRLCINIKARILSMIDESELDKYIGADGRRMVTAKRFLFSFLRDLEMYGNAFVEVAGTDTHKALYNFPALEAKVDKEWKTYQISGYKHKSINARQLCYDSPSSRFYGEPDYLATLNQITLNQNIDLYNSIYFKNGAVPRLAVIFENSEPSEEQLEAFERFFNSSFKGVEKAHKSLVISTPPNSDGAQSKIRIEELGKNNDMSFEKLKSITRDEIAAAHNVPPRLVGIVNSGGWGGQGEFITQMHAFNEICIKPKQELIEEFFAQTLGIKLVLKPLDITTFKDDSELVASLVSQGIISLQEARNMIGWQKNINESK